MSPQNKLHNKPKSSREIKNVGLIMAHRVAVRQSDNKSSSLTWIVVQNVNAAYYAVTTMTHCWMTRDHVGQTLNLILFVCVYFFLHKMHPNLSASIPLMWIHFRNCYAVTFVTALVSASPSGFSNHSVLFNSLSKWTWNNIKHSMSQTGPVIYSICIARVI